MSGFTGDALQEYSAVTPFITLEGGDLMAVLEERIPLDELLQRKKRHANETGNVISRVSHAVAAKPCQESRLGNDRHDRSCGRAWVCRLQVSRCWSVLRHPTVLRWSARANGLIGHLPC